MQKENQKTIFMFNNVYPKIVAVYEIMWKNMVEPGMPQMTTKATDTHSEYVIFIAFPRQQWLRERFSLLRYTYIASLCFFTLLFTF
jgi:hypothetical protein